MIGIYKITSPSNKINIGQSWNIDKRRKIYINLNCKGQTKLYNSLKKYGWENHKFEVIHELDENTTQEILNQYEIFYINQYKELGFELMNLKKGGNGGKWSDEMKAKFKAKRNDPSWKSFISSIHKNKINSQKTKDKMSKSRIGKKHSSETMIKILNRPKPTQKSINNRIDKLNKSIICISDNKIFKSIKEAGIYYNIDRSGISNVVRGNRKSTNNLQFKFI
jgi:group I intron endonuclease